MKKDDLPFYVFNTQVEADEALQALQRASFDMSRLSLAGQARPGQDAPLGFYSAGERIKAWGGTGAFWGEVWARLLTPAIFVLPGPGLVAMAGPIVPALAEELESAVALADVSALGAALLHVGLSRPHVAHYEHALKDGRYVLMVHGSGEEAAQARTVIATTQSWKTPD